jgi:hypothetical protein
VLQSIKWHAQGVALGDDAVLNACRGWRYAAEGIWSSKPDAGAWALRQPDVPRLVADALAARHTAARLDPAEVRRFLLFVQKKLEQAATELEPAVSPA